jgi:hypothetical protein
MGFAWMRDGRAGPRADVYQDDQGAGRRYFPSSGARASQRSPAGRHALSHGQRPLLASFGVASLVPLGKPRSALPGPRPTLDHGERTGQADGVDRTDLPSSRANRDYHGAGRGAHAARLTDVPRRASGWPGPERWRRWA